MATTEQTPNIAPLAQNAAYCLVKDNDGNISFSTEGRAQKVVEKKEGEILLTQSFKTYNVENDAQFASLVPSEKERARLANRGLDQKQYQLIKTKMEEKDKEGNFIFQNVEGSIDLAIEVAEESASRATTPDAKIERVLEGMSAADAAAIMARLLAKLQTPVSA